MKAIYAALLLGASLAGCASHWVVDSDVRSFSEMHARNVGPYSRSADILPVMFQAALQGFPNPPTGERQVNLEVGGAPAAPH